MNAIASILGTIGAWFASIILGRWTLTTGLVATVLATYTACYVAFLAAVSALTSIIPPVPMVSFSLQFMPSANAVGIAITSIFGSMAVKKACTYWVKVVSNLAKVAS